MKRLIDLDDDLLAEAQRVLGTSGISETVRASLHDTAARRTNARQIEWLRAGGMESLAHAGERAAVWHRRARLASTASAMRGASAEQLRDHRREAAEWADADLSTP